MAFTIEQILALRESEDLVEFKEAKSQYNYNSGRRSVLGYTVALANEGGGLLVFGIKENTPFEVVGSKAFLGKTGKLEQDIYRDLKVRVAIEEIYQPTTSRRVLVIKIPSRPIGKPLYFQDVPLMRVGDRLERMSDEKYLSIIQEQEPDFSAKICEGLTLEDLDPEAISILAAKYAQKQKNTRFTSLSHEQILTDLGLLQKGRLTFAALILVGKNEAIARFLPQSKTIIEFRNEISQISHDWRVEVEGPLVKGIDQIWEAIHSRNRIISIRKGPYVEDLRVFNEEVIREAVLNAITHRDYSFTAETVIRQYPDRIIINNPGGFPKGVTLENLLTVNSTPRSRLMADVLLKIGLVERSGQGVDKIFALSILDGKHEPDYSGSDFYQVSLLLNCEMKDVAFYLFLSEAHKDSALAGKLSVYGIITLAKIRDGYSQGLKEDIVQSLESLGLIVRVGSGNSKRYVLGSLYPEIAEVSENLGNYSQTELETIFSTFQGQEEVRMGDFVEAFGEKASRAQVRYLVEKLLEDDLLQRTGKGSATKYLIHPNFADKEDVWQEIQHHFNWDFQKSG